MIYPIILYGNDILTKISEPVDLKNCDSSEIKEFIDSLFETMHRANGIGLSAIQVAIPNQIFVIEAHIPENNFHFRETFINPVIHKEYGNSVKLTEGCLSVPLLTALIERFEKLDIEYYNADFKKIFKTYDGFAARIIQHEMDHLKGKIFVDKLNNMWKSMLKGSLNLIKNREVEIKYLFK